MTAEGTFPKSTGDILYDGDVNKLWKEGALVSTDQEARVTGSKEGTEAAAVTIPANTVQNGILIIWVSEFSSTAGSIKLWINSGTAGSETKCVECAPSWGDSANYTNGRQVSTLVYYDSSLTWTDAQSVTVTYTTNNASFYERSLIVLRF